ncbi:hypothetical protein FRX31_024138 [Thalictrum thalictroides]|uniref:Uncharacterized protein n=1 Tax=Thalictrum thalictroides TaxID=46969 RepID=A0A7J6VPZ3_THATH|nr:hypothetical protein FRX31_024138 [Thalictrum thalictroides]
MTAYHGDNSISSYLAVRLVDGVTYFEFGPGIGYGDSSGYNYGGEQDGGKGGVAGEVDGVPRNGCLNSNSLLRGKPHRASQTNGQSTTVDTGA